MAALLGNDDLFVVQLQDSLNASKRDEIVSVKLETIRDSVVHLAKPGDQLDNPPYSGGDAGLMYPGQGFYYDEQTGQLDVKIDSDLQFVDVLLSDKNSPADSDGNPNPRLSDGRYKTDKFWKKGLDSNDVPNTRRGNFFVVGSDDMYLGPAWYLAPGATDAPDLGDLVVCIDDSVPGSNPANRSSHLWNVIPNVTGGQAVLEIRTSSPTPSLGLMDGKEDYTEVVATGITGSNQRPVIRIRKAAFIQDATDTLNGGYYVGGLVDEHDKRKIDEFDLNLFTGGFVKSLVLHSDAVTDDALELAEQVDLLNPQYPNLILAANQGTKTTFGVVKLTKDVHVKEAVFRNSPGDSIPSTGLTDEVVMTPDMTLDNFVPRMFRTLPNLEDSSHVGP